MTYRRVADHPWRDRNIASMLTSPTSSRSLIIPGAIATPANGAGPDPRESLIIPGGIATNRHAAETTPRRGR
ncbi:hypothetical protein; putative signal peptide [Frankia alni ACN14a]|uniref:Uncharacterized protein n=1 Tax=Frankia alni (strain DSM 45986 / CECT 9034 / ACN14a) TaxID=326424 RepID=Q0RQB9_FRAAA|nr:hypothetical protein; putative signal peptide [Frankia alni ACN14a]